MRMAQPVSAFVVLPGSILPCGWNLPVLIGIWKTKPNSGAEEGMPNSSLIGRLYEFLAQVSEEQRVEKIY